MRALQRGMRKRPSIWTVFFYCMVMIPKTIGTNRYKELIKFQLPIISCVEWNFCNYCIVAFCGVFCLGYIHRETMFAPQPRPSEARYAHLRSLRHALHILYQFIFLCS